MAPTSTRVLVCALAVISVACDRGRSDRAEPHDEPPVEVTPDEATPDEDLPGLPWENDPGTDREHDEVEAQEFELAPTLSLPGAEAFDHDALLAALEEARAREFKPVGNSSVVFRMRTDGPHMAAFRPRTRSHRHGADAEVLAYRIGRSLALDNVVPAIRRVEPRRRIRDRMHRRYADAATWERLEEQLAWSGGYEVPGAAIYWVPAMEDTELDEVEQRREWNRWLRVDGELPEGEAALARDLSNMIVFDYVIGNWDRFSGGNLKVVPSPDLEHARVILRDHNAALPSALREDLDERMRAELRRVQRFSRATIDRVAALTPERLDALVGDDVNMADEALAGVLDRARVVTSHVGAQVEQHGDARVFAFP